MFEKNMRLAYLFDFYIDMFDEHSQKIMSAYYEDDLSLAEIAANVGISRQGVRHVIKKCEEQLINLEDKLSLVKKHEACQDAIARLQTLTQSLSDTDGDTAEKLREVVEILEKGV